MSHRDDSTSARGPRVAHHKLTVPAAIVLCLAAMLLLVSAAASSDEETCHEVIEGVCHAMSADHLGDGRPESPPSGARLVCPVDDDPRQVVAVYADDGAAVDWAATRASLQQAAADAQMIFDLSAHDQGAARARIPRFRANVDSGGGCVLDIERVQLPEIEYVDDLRRALAAKGFDDLDATYIVFYPSDFGASCGMAWRAIDDDPRPEVNLNNVRESVFVTRINLGCRDGYTVAHELMHNLGAVHHGAPNAVGGGHCDDGHDVMCFPGDKSACPGFHQQWRFDCDRSDYFDATGRPDGYLATHWNTADSAWLMSTPLLATDPDAPEPVVQSFNDVPTAHVFHGSIEALAADGITRGCNPPSNTLFCPAEVVTRGQMAAFLARALGLPTSTTDDFTDDDRSVFEADIQRLAAAGITRGCNPPSNTLFCPGDPVTRGEMAAFLSRALQLPSSETDWFTDDDGDVFEEEIQALSAADVTRGCNPPRGDRFCPGDPVTRGQMAAFIDRAGLTG